MYAIVDIETTGLNARKDRITEIAIYIHDGEKIVEKFESLINPECRIPFHITALTGISNKMVAEAPRFFEVAKQIVELTDGKIFIAHNASFDYNFIRCEFKRCVTIPLHLHATTSSGIVFIESCEAGLIYSPSVGLIPDCSRRCENYYSTKRACCQSLPIPKRIISCM